MVQQVKSTPASSLPTRETQRFASTVTYDL